jgi:hypothetical protein
MAKTFLKESRQPLPNIKRRGRLASQADAVPEMDLHKPPFERENAKTLLKESRQPLPNIKRSGRLASQADAVPDLDLQKRILTGAILLVALTVLSSVLFVGLRRHSKAVAVSPSGHASAGSVSPGHDEEVDAVREFEKSIGVDENGNLSAEDTVELVRKALNNRDVAQVESFFILGDSADTPLEANELSKRIRAQDGLPHGIEYLGEKVIPGGIAKEVMVSSIKGDKESNRLGQLLYRRGRWLIDMDSYARHASPGWDHILGRKCDSATVRVFVSPDNYYNGERYVEDAWKCYALISPDVEEILFGYVARGSVQDQAMERIMANEEEFHRATLEVLLSEKVNGRIQFEISRVISDDWLIGGASYDDLSWSSSRN